MAQIFYPKTNLTKTDILSETNMLTIITTITLKVLSTIKAGISILENSLLSIYKNIDKVLKDVTSVSIYVTIVSNIITTSKSTTPFYVAVITKDLSQAQNPLLFQNLLKKNKMNKASPTTPQ
jgi:hypothetical protein